MPFGWVGKILEVDLNARTMRYRDTMDYADDYLGGRALASRIAYDEIPSGVDAYHPENRVIIGTGPLTGTLAPTSGRAIVCSLSPRVYPRPWYTHSTLGGWFGSELKYAGFDAIVIHGRASCPVYLQIRHGEARLFGATDLWGHDAREAQLELRDRTGQRAQVLAIGPAGENLVRFATIQHSEENAAGHSGFGAVWGSKNLKAIVVRGTQAVRVAHKDALLQEVLRLGTFRLAPSAGVVRADKKTSQRPVCSQACTFNCLVANYNRTADGRLIPTHCIGSGAWSTEHGMENTLYVGGGVVVPPGRNFALAEEVELHELCNSLGLDLWFRLVMQPWLIRCTQLGITKIRGHHIEPENANWFRQFMHQLATRDGLGDLFADDLRRAMDELEGQLPAELVRLGHELEFNFGFPAHREGRFWDGEPLPFWLISAMMHVGESRDPTIGTHQSSLHLAEFLIADRELALKQFRVLSGRVWGSPDALEPTFEGKAPVAIWCQDQHMLIDSLPLCDFAFPQVVRPMDSRAAWRSAEDISGDLELPLRLLSAVTGVERTQEHLDEVARRAFALERIMLARAGRSRKTEESLAPHFSLPCRSDGTCTNATGFSKLLNEYYSARGWDLELGWPQADQLRSLGLDDAIPELGSLRRTSHA